MMHDDTSMLARLAPPLGALAYAVVGVATLWGPRPGSGLAALAGGGRLHGAAALVAGVVELFGAVALLDTDVAAPSSVILSLLMLGAVGAAVASGVPATGAALLCVAAALVAWTTRDERHAPDHAVAGEGS